MHVSSFHCLMGLHFPSPNVTEGHRTQKYIKNTNVSPPTLFISTLFKHRLFHENCLSYSEYGTLNRLHIIFSLVNKIHHTKRLRVILSHSPSYTLCPTPGAVSCALYFAHSRPSVDPVSERVQAAIRQ